MNKIYIGIDPGAKGAICSLSEDGKDIDFIDFTGDIPTISQWLATKIKLNDIRMVMIESVHSVFGSSASSNFKFGVNVGIMHGIVRGMGLPLDVVQPKKWQKSIGTTKKSGIELKKEIGDIARRLYPGCDIYTPRGRLLDGRSDALMIAHFLMLQYTGK